jgi:hypothetical protein
MLTNPRLFTAWPRRIAVGLTGEERGRILLDTSRDGSSISIVDVVTEVDATQAAQTFISVMNGYAA